MGKNKSQRIKSLWDNNLYRFWGKPGTKESRERTADQTLGSASARNIVKDKVLVTLRKICALMTRQENSVNCWKATTT